MTVFLSGGCKNGKSTLAEQIAVHLSRPEHLYYLATMIPHDEEDQARIRRHRAERAGLGFTTVEQGVHIDRCAEGRADGTFLLDSVTALLSNEMFPWPGDPDPDCAPRVAEELTRFAASVRHTVFVSDFLYADAETYDPLTEDYRRGLALLDRTLAALADTVIEVSAGNLILHKGELPR